MNCIHSLIIQYTYKSHDLRILFFCIQTVPRYKANPPSPHTPSPNPHTSSTHPYPHWAGSYTNSPQNPQIESAESDPWVCAAMPRRDCAKVPWRRLWRGRLYRSLRSLLMISLELFYKEGGVRGNGVPSVTLTRTSISSFDISCV